MQWEASLISKCVAEKSIRTAIRRGVRTEDFMDNECRGVWSYIVKCTSNRKFGGTVPTRKLILDRFPDFEFVKVREDMEAVVTKVKEEKLFHGLKEAFTKAKEKITQEDSFEALDQIATEISKLKAHNRFEQVLDMTAAKGGIRERYQRRKELKGITGLEYPWECLTFDTMGANNGDLITFAGRPGSMKSWCTCEIVTSWHRQLAPIKRPPLVFTKEMTPEQLQDRCAAIACRVDYARFKRGKLTKVEERDMWDDLDAWEEFGPLHVVPIHKSGLDGYTEMQSYVEEYEPGAIIFDGWYFLTKRDPGLTGELTSAFKDDLRDRWGIPGLITTQLNQDSEKNQRSYDRTTGGAYGDSYAQDSDLFVKLRRTREEAQLKELSLIPVKVRDPGIGRAFAIHSRPGINMGFKHFLETDEDDGGGRDSVPGLDDDAGVE